MDVKLSCGHRFISNGCTETIGLSNQIQAKHKNLFGKLLKKYRTKTSGESKRSARESLRFDREKQMILHKVEEQNENGEWEVVHDEVKPFEEEKK